MIEFCNTSHAKCKDDTIRILAESDYDTTTLGCDDWILAPYLAPPIGSQKEGFDSEQAITSYIKAIQKSGVAIALLKALVSESADDKHVVIGCYNSKVRSSHLSCLYDLMEDLFSEEDPYLSLKED